MRGPSVDIWKDRRPESYVRRARVLIRNCERTLRGLRVVEGMFRAPKRVREACGVGWLAVKEAIQALARSRGTPVNKLPKEVDALGQSLAEFSEIDGRAQAELHDAYFALHVDGYYEGMLSEKMILHGLDGAKSLVRRVERRFGLDGGP